MIDASDKFGIYMAVVIVVVLLAGMSATVALATWNASEKAAAYRAYTECLHEMSGKPIDVIDSFCGKIKDRL